MAKLWQKNYTLDSMMEHFTVRNDYIYDQELVLSDLIGSAAHAKGLGRIGILSGDEVSSLLSGLEEIAEARKGGAFPITLADEDCHTAIEGYLTEKLGEAGKKIHTGRSRNDQVQTALRIYMREAALKLSSAALGFTSELKPITFSPWRLWIILSRPENAPPHMNSTLVVSKGMNS